MPTLAASRARVRSAALRLRGADELETWGRPTFRVGSRVFAAVHDDLLILRSRLEDQRQRLRDGRFRAAPYWGRHGWVAIEVGRVRSNAELRDLLHQAWALVSNE